MKIFIVKILAYISIFLVIYVTLFPFIRYKYLSVFNDKNINTVILGDSHTDYIRSEEILNLSLPGSPYFIWIDLLEHIELAQKDVFISVSPCNFGNLYQSRLCDENLNPGWNERYIVEFRYLLKVLNFDTTLYPEELIRCLKSYKFSGPKLLMICFMMVTIFYLRSN